MEALGPNRASMGLLDGSEVVQGTPDLAQFPGADVGIDLRRAGAGMAKQLLDEAEVGARFQQMSGEGVAEHVGRYRLGDSRTSTGSGHQSLNRPTGKRPLRPAAGEEEWTVDRVRVVMMRKRRTWPRYTFLVLGE